MTDTVQFLDKFLTVTTKEIKQISSTIKKRIRVQKVNKTINRLAQKHFERLVKSFNGKVIVCNNSIVLIEIHNNDGTKREMFYKYL